MFTAPHSSDDLKNEKELKENTLRILELEIDSALEFQFSMDSKSQAMHLLAEKRGKMAEQRKLLKAAPIVQKRFLRRMLDCLIYTSNGIKTFYHMDILTESRNRLKNSKKAEGDSPLAFFFCKHQPNLSRVIGYFEFVG